ncbi:MAG TPA: PAS domain S-box protein, partial [Steroidobacteraceae bacterium]|nr:PAS domain S-box protein [Steroidobacteraceae bacterium]
MLLSLRGAAAALRASQSRYETLLRSIDQGFCIIEVLFDAVGQAVDYRFLETNQAFEAHTGIPDAVGRRMREIVPDHEHTWFEHYGRVALTGEPVQFESRAAALRRVFEVYAYRVDAPEEHRVAVLFKDITERAAEAERRRQSEAALRESEMRFRRLADAMPQLVWTATAEGVVDYYNTQVARYGGIRRSAEGSWLWPPILHPDDAERTGQAWDDAIATGETYECEHRVRMADGTFRWHLSRAHRVGPPSARQWFGTATDIHELKLAEERLRESEQRFKTMANTAPAMLWITNEHHQCTFRSRGWYEYTGQHGDDGLGMGWLKAVHAEDRSRARDTFLRAAERHEPFNLDYRLCAANGDHRWAIDAGRPRFDDAGVFLGFIGSIFDVHERKQAEEALRDADRRKDEFLAVLAHELRNPLAPLRNGLEVLRRARPDSEGARSARGMMERQVDHMVRLIDDLLDTSRIARGMFQLHATTVDLVETVRNALETSRPLLDAAGHRFRARLPERPLIVRADPVRIAQVLTNLLNNAAHYTEPGGCVTISVDAEGAEAIVEVEDDGIGIPPDMLERVFEPFVQLETSIRRGRQHGLGLGLALARSIVELHGGSIRASAGRGGRGSLFTVRLPLNAAPVVSVDTGLAAQEGAGGLRVLVVDDNRDAAESLGMLLGLMGHEVRLAHDGPQALRAVRDDPPDIVFLDIGMPGMDGYEVARRLGSLPGRAGMTLVALTGYGQAADRRRSAEVGFDAHLVKPAEIETLEALMAAPRGPAAASPQ